MKILINFLLLLLAFGQSLQAQENDTLPPPIDFKEYVAIMTPIMCDSIYRVDTLYYPFEGNVQMIELRWKTVLKKEKKCNSNLSDSFKRIASVFLFRDKKGKFLNIYNTLNIIIDTSSLKSVDFVNTKAYKNDYIIIEKFDNSVLSNIHNSLENKKAIYPGYGYQEIIDYKYIPNLFKGLINKKGEIIFPAIYLYIALYKEDNSIVLVDYKKNKYNTSFYNYNDLSLLQYYEDLYISIDRKNIGNHISLNTPYFILANNKLNCLVDHRGNKIIENMHHILYTPNLIMVINENLKYGLLNDKLEYILDTIYQSINIYSKNDNEYFAKIRLNEKEGIISLDNKILLPIEYDSIIVNTKLMTGEYIYLVKKNNLKGVLNEEFEAIIPIKYSNIYMFSNYFLLDSCDDAEENNKSDPYMPYMPYNMPYVKICYTGIYDSNHTLLIEPMFIDYESFSRYIVLYNYFEDSIKNKIYILYNFHKSELQFKITNKTHIEYSHINKNGKIVLKAYNSENHSSRDSKNNDLNIEFIELE